MNILLKYHLLSSPINSTRNNDFSNRNQKGRVMVVLGDVAADAIGVTGGSLRLKMAEVVVDPGVLDDVHQIRAQVLTEEEFERKISKSRRNLVYEAVSPFLVVSPEETIGRAKKGTGDDGGMRLFINVDEHGSGKTLKVTERKWYCVLLLRVIIFGLSVVILLKSEM